MKHKKLFFPALAACLGFNTLHADAQSYADMVMSASQGPQKNMAPVSPFRSNTANALGVPQEDDTQYAESAANFYSLGFGGNIVLRMATPFTRGAGNDFDLFETSYGNPSIAQYPEQTMVEFSQDGSSWVMAGSGYLNFGVELPAVLQWARYVRLTDISNPAQFGASDADGWDVDGVRANYQFELPPNPPDVCPGYAGNEFMGFVQGTQKNGSAVPANRSIPGMATGAPQASDVTAAPNFVSLGFDNPATPVVEGQIILHFLGTIIDNNGAAADLQVFETTFGDNVNAPKPINQYPEIALFEGSVDGINWTVLNTVGEEATLAPGHVCRDGLLDISSMPLTDGVRALNYIRVTDMSIRSSSRFPGSADGYDLDGITPCLGTDSTSARFGDMNQQIGEADAAVSFGVAPNPATIGAKATISFTVEIAGQRTLEMFDMTGKKVQTIASADFAEGAHFVEFNASAPSNGIYMIRISDKDGNSNSIRVSLTK